jgi:pimeloyl-ACP methyl ester carboxylesterase
MAQLAADYFIIAPDLPGQGDSDKPASQVVTLNP